MNDDVSPVNGALARGLMPDPDLPIDQWAEKYMYIPRDSGANEYGKYKLSRTPHARQPMQCLSPHDPCKRVVLMGASQMLKTQIALNFFCATVHQSPSNFIWAVPTGNLVKRASNRIDKTIAVVNEVAERVAPPGGRSATNNLNQKDYDGGALHLMTTGAAANLSELSARYIVLDEVDRVVNDVNGEGDPVQLLDARQTSFEGNRKFYLPSSPTTEDESIIEPLFKQGTQHHALAECPHCGQVQELDFFRLVESEDGQNALYPCISAECGAFMVESDKTRMFEKGLWSDGVSGDGLTESFTISAMYLPYGWKSWRGLMDEYQKAKAELDAGDDFKMKVFYNTRLARSWKVKKERADIASLKERAEPYRLGRVPAGVLGLTASIDTQDKRLEIKVVGWGEGLEGWIVDYQQINEDPALKSTWIKADAVLAGKYRHAFGQMLSIEAAMIDSGGSHTQEVYDFTSGKKSRNIFAIKGASKPGRPILSSKPTLVEVQRDGKQMKDGAELWFIGTDTAKDYLAQRWKLASGPGAIHFSQDLDDAYYRGLTAEYRITKRKNGKKISVWDKKDSDANEPLDLMVYALGAAHYLGWHRWTEDQWRRRRDRLCPPNRDMFLELDIALDSDAGKEAVAAQIAAAPPVGPLLIQGGKISLTGMRRGQK